MQFILLSDKKCELFVFLKTTTGFQTTKIFTMMEMVEIKADSKNYKKKIFVL